VLTNTFYLNVTYPPTITAVLSMPVTIVRPADGQPHPAVVLVPGGNGASYPAHGRSGTASTIASWGYTVVFYELVGRFDPGLPAAYPPCAPLNCNWEYPIDDYAGVQEQTEFNALLDWLVNAPFLEGQIRRLPSELGNRRMIGIHTSSFGITIATGALALRAPAHPQNDAVVLDVEGPEAGASPRWRPTPAPRRRRAFATAATTAFWDPRRSARARRWTRWGNRRAVTSDDRLPLPALAKSSTTQARIDAHAVDARGRAGKACGSNSTRALTGEIENVTAQQPARPAEINTRAAHLRRDVPAVAVVPDPNDPHAATSHADERLHPRYARLPVRDAARPRPRRRPRLATATATPTATATRDAAAGVEGVSADDGEVGA
jgi:hypothetical protein